MHFITETSLRGDINVCIVGDPSTAKSQILKQVKELFICVCSISPLKYENVLFFLFLFQI